MNETLKIDWDILNSKRLSSTDKLLLAFLRAINFKHKKIRATNHELAALLNVSHITISTSLRLLAGWGWVKLLYENQSRRIIIINPTPQG